jgi:IS30 family transposase
MNNNDLTALNVSPPLAISQVLSKELNAEFYFAHPYSSWERGLNENTNGLVRQYLKKGSSFSHVTDKLLSFITDQLNNRPRKSLGYESPNEISLALMLSEPSN